MAKRPDRTCPITGLPVPYKGFCRPSVYHDTAQRKCVYEYSGQERATLALANRILRDAKAHPTVIEAANIRKRARAYERSVMKPVKPRPYKRALTPRQ